MIAQKLESMFPLQAGCILVIGPYELSKCKHGGFWIAHESGEGTQVGEQTVIDLIDKFFKESM